MDRWYHKLYSRVLWHTEEFTVNSITAKLKFLVLAKISPTLHQSNTVWCCEVFMLFCWVWILSNIAHLTPPPHSFFMSKEHYSRGLVGFFFSFHVLFREQTSHTFFVIKLINGKWLLWSLRFRALFYLSFLYLVLHLWIIRVSETDGFRHWHCADTFLNSTDQQTLKP